MVALILSELCSGSSIICATVAKVTPVTVKWQEGSYDTRGIQLTGLTKVDSLKKLLRRQHVLLY